MISKDFLMAKAGREAMACAGFAEFVERLDFVAIGDAVKASHDVDAYGEPGYSLDGGVATIAIRGLLVPNLGADLSAYGITGYDIISQYIENAEEDENVSAIVLDIDSVGGYTSGLSGAVESIEAAAKPVTAHASGDAYSAAYWLASTPGELTAAKGSGIGSIGVYLEHYDYSAQLEAEGITSRIFKSGFWKGAFSSDRPLTEREAARLQEEVDEKAQAFFGHVSEKRGLKSKSIEKLEGDSFSSERALELGLIDEITEGFNMPKVEDNSTKAEVGATEAVFTQAQVTEMLEAATKLAADAAMASAMAHADRTIAVAALETTDEIKAILSGDKFQSVATADLAALVAAMPKSDLENMKAEGGAGVGVDRTEFVSKTENEVKAEEKKAAQQAALDHLAKAKGIL